MTARPVVVISLPLVCDVCGGALDADHMKPENWHGPTERTWYLADRPRRVP